MRTRYSFYNFIVSTFAAVILPLVGFIKVRLFIDFYGQGVNGLQVTIAQTITFLNICELAYSLAFRQLLYKPLANDDRAEVLNIYHGARKIFKITGTIVFVCAFILALSFPFFSDSPLSYPETVMTVLILALPYAISYFLMGPNFVIIADQKEYKINIWIQLIAILRMFLMVLVIKLRLPFVWIVCIEGCNVLSANILARWIALKAYPWLKNVPQIQDDRQFQHKAKFAMIQRLSELATTQTDNIVITAFMGYEMTSVFANYSYLTDSVGKITQSMITSPMNSFGNLLNDKNGDTYRVFTEFFNFTTYISSIVAISIFIIMPRFVHIWLNNSAYEASILICLIFAINIFYMTMRQPVIICRDANGLYVNAKNNAYLLAISKVVLSVLLVGNFDFYGILFATLITNWTIDFLYNPNLVYKHVFGLPVFRYYRMVFIRLLIATVVGASALLIWNMNLPYIEHSFLHFVVATLILGVGVTLCLTLLYSLLFASYRHLFVRVKSILSRRAKRKYETTI